MGGNSGHILSGRSDNNNNSTNSRGNNLGSAVTANDVSDKLSPGRPDKYR